VRGPGKSYGDERTDAVRKYTEDDCYNDLNYSMRAYEHKRWENTIHLINEAIGELPKERGRHPILYRGIGGCKSKLKKGQVISFKAFASTSKNEECASDFGHDGLLLEFHTWRNGADISRYSAYPDEEEVLLAPYQSYKVTSISGNRVVLEVC
jgi:hypothetical protein